jgi:hypothetical protein
MERTKSVINRTKTLDLMEERYSEKFFEKDLKDSSSYLFNLRKAFQTNTDPWLKVKGVNNYYRKKLTFNFGQNLASTETSQYFVRGANNSFLVDWEASLSLSDLPLDNFDTRKKKDYVMMRVYMKIEENFRNKSDMPEYFCVRINQEDDKVSKEAIIYKNSENGMKLYDVLLDGKWHTKVIWVKYFDCLSKNSKSYKETINDNRLIGFVNSIEADNWIIDNDPSGKEVKFNLEDPNLSTEIKKYENYLKAQDIINNPPLKLKTLNAAKVEYYEKQIILYGYISLDSYYNWGYQDAETTHYSFKLKDNEYESVQLYMKKSLSKSLFDQLTKEEKLAVKITAIPYQSKQESNFGNILLEGLTFEVIK